MNAKNLSLIALSLGLICAFAANLASADPPKPMGPVEECKFKADFKYNFDMMKIEGDEIRKAISHEEAREQKNRRHKDFKEEIEDCEDLKND